MILKPSEQQCAGRCAQTGTIVQATAVLNWTEQTPRFAYASLQPNLVDRAPYAAALAGLTAVAQGLASGRATYGAGVTTSSCNGLLPALNRCGAPRSSNSPQPCQCQWQPCPCMDAECAGKHTMPAALRLSLLRTVPPTAF